MLSTLKSILSSRWLNYSSAAAAAVIISVITFSTYIPYTVHLQVGDVAPETIVSPRYLEFESAEDQKKTAEIREQRAALVQPIYSIDEEVNKAIQADIINSYTVMRQYVSEMTSTGSVVAYPTELSFLSSKSREVLQTDLFGQLGSLEYVTRKTSRRLLDQGIQDINTAEVRADIHSEIQILRLPSSQEQLIQDVILQALRPNLVLDDAQTAALKQKEMDAIIPFTTIYKEGDPIIYVDEWVSPEHIEVFKALNIYGLSANAFVLIGIGCLTLLMIGVLDRFIWLFSRNDYSMQNAVIIFINILITLLFARIFYDFQSIPYAQTLHYLAPVSLVTVCVSILVSPNLAMLVGALVSILIALMYQGDFSILIFLFVSNCVAAFASNRIFKRIELIRAGNIVGLANIVLIIIIGLLRDIPDPLWYLGNGVVALANALLAAMIALAILPYFENTFKITTSLNLIEQADLNHPLLKKLLLSAPGTYQHSLMVANLAEAAADEIGADGVLARIGSYFHDIGKMKRPSFFIENQFSGENPHDSLSPRMSKIIIAAHPKDGVEMANKYKLPKVLTDFMMQHHGTSLVSYFYTQALHASEGSEEIAEEEFRYPGPKPQIKESGIIMLADAVEASVRALDKPTLPKIEGMVDRIFQDKIMDKQLNECDLSMKEIETIKGVFIRLFKSIYHSRIDYQEEIQQFVDGR